MVDSLTHQTQLACAQTTDAITALDLLLHGATFDESAVAAAWS